MNTYERKVERKMLDRFLCLFYYSILLYYILLHSMPIILLYSDGM